MRTLFLAGLFAAAGGTAAAQDNPIGRIDSEVTGLIGEDANLIVGGGLGAITQPYVGAKGVKYVPEPLIIFQSDRFEFIGRSIGFELWSNEHLAVNALGQWRFFGHDGGGDSDFLAGMDERKSTGELGFRVEYEIQEGRGQVSGAAVADALSRHGGWEVEARASYELSTWAPLSVRPNGGVRYQSSSLADYYFGVDPEEALIQANASPGITDDGLIVRPAYDVGDVLTPFVGLVARQSVHPKVAVVGGFDLNLLDEEVRDSPIVDEDVQLFAFIGMIYVFGDAASIAAAAE